MEIVTLYIWVDLLPFFPVCIHYTLWFVKLIPCRQSSFSFYLAKFITRVFFQSGLFPNLTFTDHTRVYWMREYHNSIMQKFPESAHLHSHQYESACVTSFASLDTQMDLGRRMPGEGKGWREQDRQDSLQVWRRERTGLGRRLLDHCTILRKFWTGTENPHPSF